MSIGILLVSGTTLLKLERREEKQMLILQSLKTLG